MSELTDDVEVRVVSEAAQHFVDTFYSAINNPRARESLTEFYLKPTEALKVDLNFNGTILPDPAALQEVFTKQIQKCHYDVQAFDCHAVNTNYTIGMPQNLPSANLDSRKISILVLVNGAVKYFSEAASQTDSRGFTDTVILVPNWDSLGPKGDKKLKRWLIQSQTFRLVV